MADYLQPFAYIVTWNADYEGQSVEGVFSTREAAEAFRAKKGNTSHFYYEVEEWYDGETR